MQATNFTADAARSMSRLENNSRDPGVSEWASALRKALESSAVFMLPAGGRLFNDGYRGIKGEVVRSPSPIISIETTTDCDCGCCKSMPFMALAIASNELCDAGCGNEHERVMFIPFHRYDELKLWLPQYVTGKMWEHWDCGQSTVQFDVLEGFGVKPDHEHLERQKVSVGAACAMYLELCEALSCSNVSSEIIQRADPTVNAKRTRKGKLPLYETRVLVIDTPHEIAPKEGSGLGSHASPRQHLRRGHIRRIAPRVQGEAQRKIWVNSCVVGKASNGVIAKKYEVRSA